MTMERTYGEHRPQQRKPNISAFCMTDQGYATTIFKGGNRIEHHDFLLPPLASRPDSDSDLILDMDPNLDSPLRLAFDDCDEDTSPWGRLEERHLQRRMTQTVVCERVIMRSCNAFGFRLEIDGESRYFRFNDLARKRGACLRQELASLGIGVRHDRDQIVLDFDVLDQPEIHFRKPHARAVALHNKLLCVALYSGKCWTLAQSN